MLTKFLVGTALVLYIAVNIYTAVSYDPMEMYDRYVKGQCTVGRISAAVFYAPAWFLKVFKKAVVRAIK